MKPTSGATLEAPVAEERPPRAQCGAGGHVGTHLSWNYVRYAGAYGVAFVSSVVLARCFRPADYGVYVGAFAVASFLSMLISLGLEGSALILVPKFDSAGDKRALGSLLRTMLGLRLAAFTLLGLGATLGYCLGWLRITQPALARYPLSSLGIYGALALGLSMVDLTSAILNGLFKFSALCILDIASGLVTLVAVGGAAYAGASVRLTLAVAAGAKLAFCGVYIGAFGPQLGHASGWAHPKRLLSSCTSLYGVRVLQYWVMPAKDVLLLGFLTRDAAQAAFYAVASKAVDILSNCLTLGFGGVAQPHFSRLAEEGGRRELGRAWGQFMSFQILMSVLPIGYAIAQGGNLLRFVYSTRYSHSGELLQVAALLMLLETGILGGGVSNKVIFGTEKNRLGLLFIGGGAAVNLALAFVLIPSYGALGAVIATGLATLVWRAIETGYAIRFLRAAYPWRPLARVLACALPAIVVSRSLGPNVFLGSLAYGVVALSLAALLRPIDAHVLSVLRGCPPALLKIIGKFSQPERSDAQHLSDN
ncbi:MAG TPA: lipopolysaccharide biosynthesis protein [Verrucomicrobiae bacterium]|nr:lipopolysaccharide biosynthesis protein [Verrucomicrobiae bacterium]